MSPRRFSSPVLTAIQDSRILGIQAGTEPHRFVGIWAVVLRGRVFVRPWNDKPHGWYRVFQKDPRGRMQIPSGRVIRVRAKPVRGERLIDAIDAAYGEKYTTPASRQYVIGFARPRRRKTTTELVPMTPPRGRA